MSFRLFGRRRSESAATRTRYVSGLQRDVNTYQGWTRGDVEADYRATKNVRTIITLGYLEYSDDVLTLTEKGRSLMQNVPDHLPSVNDARA